MVDETDQSPGAATGAPARQITRLGDEGRPLTDETLTDLYVPPARATPWLRANFVTSIDGAVQVGGVSSPLSSPADQRLLVLLRRQCDVLLLGAGTLRAERYGPIRLAEDQWSWRRERGLAPEPALAIVSDRLDLDPRQPAFADAPVPPIVFTHAAAPAARREALSATTEVISVGGTHVDLTAATAVLRQRGHAQILCEGGPHLFAGLVAADLVDELCLTLSPLLAGAGGGRMAAGADAPGSPHRLILRQVLTAGDSLFLRYLRAR
jgi:riboflavin biosynthesis pyrimidine reductase